MGAGAGCPNKPPDGAGAPKAEGAPNPVGAGADDPNPKAGAGVGEPKRGAGAGLPKVDVPNPPCVAGAPNALGAGAPNALGAGAPKALGAGAPNVVGAGAPNVDPPKGAGCEPKKPVVELGAGAEPKPEPKPPGAGDGEPKSGAGFAAVLNPAVGPDVVPLFSLSIVFHPQFFRALGLKLTHCRNRLEGDSISTILF